MKDRDVRILLRGKLDLKHAGDPSTRIVEELGVNRGTARVDVAVINGSLDGYEIKSERDTLERLPGQVAAYSAVLDRVTLVCAASHLDKAEPLVPPWWGITSVSTSAAGNLTLVRVRAAKLNRGTDACAVARLLWRDEALGVLEEIGEATGFRSKSRDAICGRLAQAMPKADLLAEVRRRLRVREGWRTDGPRTSCGGSPPPSAMS